jgi:hypothetical protein
MLTVWSDRLTRACDQLPRRDFVKAGLLGVGGLSLADILRSRAAATAAGQTTSRPKSVILYWIDGGPSHLETYDPKPHAPSEYRGMFGSIDTNVPGIRINELLVEHAKIMDRMSILRSVHHNHGDHFAAAHWMLTGYLGSNSTNLDPVNPSVGSIIAKLRGPNASGMPSYVGIPQAMSVGIQPGYFSGAYLGVAYNPLPSGGDPNDANYKVPNLDLPGGLTIDRLGDRRHLLSTFDRMRRDADASGVMNGLDSFNQQAFEMVIGEAARRAFNIHEEDPKVRDRYGREHYGQCALLARRLVEAGVTFVNIHNGGWDHHWDLESGMKSRLPTMDRAVSTLVADLDERGLLDDTLVVVMGEFSRTPRLNDGGNGGAPRSMGAPGRDHWGNVMSVLIGGGGLKGGQVVGASNSKGEAPAERPLTPADVLATIYQVVGVDLNLSFNNRAGRPIPINNSGSVITELL